MSNGLRIGGSGVATIRFRYDEIEIEAVAGDTVAAAMLAAGRSGFARHPVDGAARGLFCASGVCQECCVVIDGRIVEACRVRVREGMAVRSRR
jgi:predicted molibdopterin-dependent oxidoreductase YjgC